MLYSLGIGFQRDNMNKSHMKYTYENAENFMAYPTNAHTVCHRGPFANGEFDIPGVPPFNPMTLLHGEESLTIHKPLRAEGEYVVAEKVVDLQDKGKGFVLIFDAEIREKDTKELQSICRSSLYVRAKGGFGHKGSIKTKFPLTPKREPDYVGEEKTDKNQAFIYRLSNDMNPLHVDPDMAAMGGFEVPILHGLCFYGMTVRSVQERFFKEDPSLMKKITVRFTSFVFPGETLVVQAWKEKDQIVFVTKTKERGKAVLMGYLDLSSGAKL